VRIKKLTQFRRENIEPDANGNRPCMRTLQKWQGAFKEAGTWYMDMDLRRDINNDSEAIDNRIQDIAGDDADLHQLISGL
tara:strand:- start:236 stop:475 length:240 start_codon:yes stop_codon:yes gene_type:complete